MPLKIPTAFLNQANKSENEKSRIRSGLTARGKDLADRILERKLPTECLKDAEQKGD